jgi:putative transcriptional regulator
MEFFKYKNKLKPEKGRILVSEPYLPDPNFDRTIVLLCEHNEEGSFGFVLNKPSEAAVNEVLNDIKSYPGKVYVGGPVQQDTLHFIHRYPALEDSVEIAEGIFWGGNFDRLVFHLQTKQIGPEDVKFFVGYSGWSQGQLEEEMEMDSWIVTDKVTEELIFETNPKVMWQKVLKNMGGRFSVYSNYPADPRLN